MSNSITGTRVDEESLHETSETTYRHPDLWFDDGSIVLKVQSTMFKVHRSLLCSHSTVFADMFSVCQPTIGLDMMVEGCAVVDVPDRADDFTYLLKALFDPM